MPITWRNINDNSGYREASLLLRSAGNSLNDGFDRLSGVVEDVQAREKANFGAERTFNTELAKDALAKYRSPEALAAAQADGSLDAELAGIGPNVDPSVIRDGANEQLDILRSRANETRTYEDGLAQSAARPVLDQIAQARAADNDPLVAKLMEENRDVLQRANALGSTTEANVAQDRKELDQFWVDRDRDRGEELYQKNRKADEFITNLHSDLLASGLDSSQGRLQMIQELNKQGIYGDKADAAISTYDSKYEGAYGMNTAQRKDEEIITKQAENARQGEISIAQNQLDITKRDHPVAQVFNSFDPAAVTPGKITEYMTNELGINDDDAPGMVKDAIDFAKKARFKDGKPNSKDQSFMAAVQMEAVRRIGADEEFLPKVIDAQDLNGSQDDLNTVMLEVLDEYILAEKNRGIVDEATQSFINTTNKANGTASAKLSEYRQRIKDENTLGKLAAEQRAKERAKAK